MKTRKIRLLSALLALAMLLALLPTAAFADTVVYGTFGNCGATNEDKVTWKLENGTLTISGTGAMADYVVGKDQPWYGQKGNIKKFVVENGVTTIGNTAFCGHTELTEVDMSNATSLEKIGQYAFESCTGVKTIDLSNAIKLKEIGDKAFKSSGVESVTFPQNSQLTEIGNEVFAYCNNLKNIEIPEPVTKIGGSAFQYAGLTGIEIPASVTDIGNFAFEGTKLTSIKIPASVTGIGIRAFGECKNLKTVTFADDSPLKNIWTRAFAGTPITSIEIPASVTNIGTGAFEQCEQLESVTFAPGSKLKTIGENAFSGCDNLQTVYYDGNNDGLKQSLQSQLGEKFKNGWTVKFETEGGSAVAQQNVKNGQTATKPTDPTKDGYIFAGWYTKDANDKWAENQFDFNTPIKNDMTLYARWGVEATPITPATRLYPITIDYGTAYDADHNVITKAAKGETVYVEASETALDGMAFERWEVRKGEVKLENDRAAKTSFTMPAGEVQLEAMYQAAEANDSGWDAATVVTGAVIGTGTAILAYHIGMEVYAEQVLGKDVAVPRTRAEVALLAWQLAGSPAVNVEGEPLSEAAQAERWAVESGLLQPDAEGNFHAEKKLSKWKALRTLDAAKKQV